MGDPKGAEVGLKFKKERFNFLKSIVVCDNLCSVDGGSEFSAEVRLPGNVNIVLSLKGSRKGLKKCCCP